MDDYTVLYGHYLSSAGIRTVRADIYLFRGYSSWSRGFLPIPRVFTYSAGIHPARAGIYLSSAGIRPARAGFYLLSAGIRPIRAGINLFRSVHLIIVTYFLKRLRVLAYTRTKIVSPINRISPMINSHFVLNNSFSAHNNKQKQ